MKGKLVLLGFAIFAASNAWSAELLKVSAVPCRFKMMREADERVEGAASESNRLAAINLRQASVALFSMGGVKGLSPKPEYLKQIAEKRPGLSEQEIIEALNDAETRIAIGCESVSPTLQSVRSELNSALDRADAAHLPKITRQSEAEAKIFLGRKKKEAPLSNGFVMEFNPLEARDFSTRAASE